MGQKHSIQTVSRLCLLKNLTYEEVSEKQKRAIIEHIKEKYNPSRYAIFIEKHFYFCDVCTDTECIKYVTNIFDSRYIQVALREVNAPKYTLTDNITSYIINFVIDPVSD